MRKISLIPGQGQTPFSSRKLEAQGLSYRSVKGFIIVTFLIHGGMSRGHGALTLISGLGIFPSLHIGTSVTFLSQREK